MAKIIITGGAGFIGSHVCDKLLLDNHKLAIIDNLSSGTIDNLSQSAGIKLYKLDTEKDDLSTIFEVENPDYVIHLAAQTSVNYSLQNPCYDANVNIISSIKLLELCKNYGVKRLIAASTAAVYGTPEYTPIDEKHPLHPISQYGLSKLTMEKYIEMSGLPYIIFRFSNAYGPRQKTSKESGVISIFHEAMINDEPINIYGDGMQVRDFVYVEDIAKIFSESIKIRKENFIVNFSTNIGTRLNDLYDKMKIIYNHNKTPQYLPKRNGDIKDSILSNKKAMEIFSVSNFTSLENGLEKLNKFYTDTKNFKTSKRSVKCK